MMFLRRILICALVCTTLSLSGRTKPAPPVDPEYISALTAANNFLHAWQAHDEEAGMLLLSDQLREHSTVAAVSTFFSAHPQQTYEITRGRKLANGRYQFPITLWQAPASSASTSHPKPHTSMLLVTRTAKDDWLIDNLP
jgi:hypothetical protein